MAIDGGNSKTDVVVGTSDGDVLAHARGAGTCHQNIGLPRAMSRLRALVAQVRSTAGVAPDFAFERADVFLAGADLPSEMEMLIAAVEAEAWAKALRLDNDTLALLRAGTDAAEGVAVVCGAGINCVGRTADGRTARFPSLGNLSGDWGGGGHLAWLALWHAIRGEDGRGPGTALTGAVADHFGLPTAGDVGAQIHLGALEHGRLTELTPLLFDVAAAGDGVARSVVARQAKEVVALVTVTARRLDLVDLPFAVVLGGGVLRARHALLQGAIEAGILAAAPKATVSVVEPPPVLGAALFALDALGANAAAHAVLRANPIWRPA